MLVLVSTTNRICLDSLDISGSVVEPVMGPFHMLLEITLAFALIRAVRVLTIELVRDRAMLVVEMPISLLFCRPSMLMVFARWLTAFPGS